MCGIAGISSAKPADPEFLRSMGESLSHRGPDDMGIYTQDTTGLVHTRLSIIDLEGGHQPLLARNDTLILVANGEIYNFVELRSELTARGHCFSTHSDCEVILHAYLEYGDDFLDHLQGMFAFALYDQNNKRLILARDRLGIKPLFLATTPQGLAFASEIKALLPLYGSTPGIDPQGLAQYFHHQCNSGQTTIFKTIGRVLPGEAVCIESGTISRRWRYWSATNVQPLKYDADQARQHFDELIDIVMRQHIRSDVPFGLFLSGGLDSSTLFALLNRYVDHPVQTFSVGFPGTSIGSELSQAQILAEQFGSRHTVITPDKNEMYHRLPHSIWAADELMRDNASLPTSLLAEKASQDLKVVFTGEGSDEVFAGYGRYRRTQLVLWLKNLLAPGSGGFRTRAAFPRKQSNSVFGAALKAAYHDAREAIIQAWQESPASWSDLQRMQFTDMTTALPDNLLVKVDRMLMAWGVEGRVPFLDHRIVEFGLALPDELKIQQRHGKIFLRHWAAPLLPEDHIWRKKKGFSVPVGEWLTDDFLERLDSVLPGHPAIREWCHPEGVRALIRQQKKRGDSSRMLLTLLQFAIWYQIFIINNGARPPLLQDPVLFISRH